MERLEEDLKRPVAPGTRCRAEYDFAATGEGELQFSSGDVLTLEGPSERLFWYHARHLDRGKRGLIPITHVALPTKGLKRMIPGVNGFETDTNDRDPLADDDDDDDGYERMDGPIRNPRLEPCYKSFDVFKRLSGWFTARVAVGCEASEALLPRSLAEKCGITTESLIANGPAIYTFQHKRDRRKKYVGHAYQICTELQQLFLQLYQKKVDRLNGLEREILFNSPVANDWVVSIDLLSKHEEPDMEWMAQRQIIEMKSLQGEKSLGLNDALKFTSRDSWDKFLSWFSELKRSQADAAGRRIPPPRPI